MSESLYADKPGFTTPNNRIAKVVRETLDKAEGRILFNISNAQFYRIQELFNELMLTDKKVVIMGKKLENMINKAIDLKYLEFDKEKFQIFGHVNDDDAVVLISDEREKPFSNISRIVRGYDKFVKINDKDTVVFAAPIYDGMGEKFNTYF